MKSKKRKILLCWGYHRQGWLHAFKALQDDFEFYYLFYLSKPENEINHSGTESILYWTDFSSAQDIINQIKPHKIVFMGIDSINTIALNIIAKKRGIETLVLQHGMFHTYSDYLNLALEEMKERNRTKQFSRSSVKVDRVFLLRFFLRSVAFADPRAIFFMIKLQYLKRKYVEVEALRHAPSKFRMPSTFVVFTRGNASIYCERDGAEADELIEIGNPEMDAYFAYASKTEQNEGDYYLLVDQPWTEVKEYSSPGFGISKEQTNNFYQKLANYAEKKSAKLKIKLHPYSYDSDFLSSHPNIEYVKDADMVELIMQSKGVFGFNSTLTLPAIYFNRCCLFKIWEASSYQDEIKKLGLAQVLDYHSFTEEDINFAAAQRELDRMNSFVKKYFYRADSNAIQRLKEILQQDDI